MDKIVTTVAASGVAETSFDIATFNVHLSANDAVAPAARVRLRSKIDDLDSAIRELVDNHQVSILDDSTKTIMVSPVYSWGADGQRMSIWTGTYDLKFQTDSMDKVNRIYEILSAVHEATVGYPSFSLRNKEALNKKALRNAWAQVTDRFSDECEVLGVSSADHEISSWEVTYEDTKRNSMSAKIAVPPPRGARLVDEAPADELINIEPGKANVVVDLSVAFKKKNK